MKIYRVQLLADTMGAYRGAVGDILEAPADKARGLALAGLAVICGDEVGEIIEPETIDISPGDEGRDLELPPAGEQALAAADAPDDGETLFTGPMPLHSGLDGAPQGGAEPFGAAGPGKPRPAASVTAAAMRLALANGIDIAAVLPGRPGKVTRGDVRRHLDGLAAGGSPAHKAQ